MKLDGELIAGLTVDESAVVTRIASELGVREVQVSAVVTLTREGGTVPFISRYRKEATGSLDEVQVRQCVERFGAYSRLETRRIQIIQAIHAQGKLDQELLDNLGKCSTITEMEDIYAPFRKKRKTRGMLAREKGLEPLAQLMRVEPEAVVLAAAAGLVRQDAEHPELSVGSVEEAIQGAMDIIAESVSQDPDNRAAVKKLYLRTGRLVVRGIGDEEKRSQSVYQMYWDYAEPLSSLKPHRVLAINRGVREGELETKIEVDEPEACSLLRGRRPIANHWHGEAIDDGLRRLLSSAVLREIQAEAAEGADLHAIGVFSENLRNLLMSPPIRGTRVIGMDPGIRTGTKCAAMDETGRYLGSFVIYQERDAEAAKKAIAAAVTRHHMQLIAVGNGTGSHEVRKLVAEAIAESTLEAKCIVVDEDGASVYSAGEVAREEFPDLDLTIRGAISIGRRLQDPLAELVKIDPKSLGVGLYQHDVNQKRLSEKLDEVVGSVVNRVGVNINTASPSLLRYVSGINASLAKRIVQHRDKVGKLLSRETLRGVPGMGPKSFEQCAGFLKIPESQDPLDNSWVHPESYPLAREILSDGKPPSRLADSRREELKKRHCVGDATLDDILAELAKPNRDPREEYPSPLLDQGVLCFEDLREGMKLKGKVKNVVDFGAFIDIGIKESALLHVSEMSDAFVRDPMEVVKVGDVKEVRIISLDPIRRRIGVSLKSPQEVPKEAAAAGPSERRPKAETRRPRPAPPPPTSGSDTTYNPFAEFLRKKRGRG